MLVKVFALKVLAGEEVTSTLHFLKVLSQAASTESMIQASNAAAEEVLNSGISDIYKKGVRVRNSFTLMQSFVRERLAAKTGGVTTGGLCATPNDIKITHSPLVVDNEVIVPRVQLDDIVSSLVQEENHLTFTEDSHDLLKDQNEKVTLDASNQVPKVDSATSTPSRERPSLENKVVGFDLVKLDLEQKRLFRLRNEIREKLKRTREQEDLLKSREAHLDEKESRVKRLAEHLKKQQLQLAFQSKKHHEAMKLSKNFGDDEHICSENFESTRLQLKEREDRISRLEKKLQKLQSRLLKKQQERDFSINLHQATPGVVCAGNDEKRYCCQSMQTDGALVIGPQDTRTKHLSGPILAKMEPFLFCDDAKVLYTHAVSDTVYNWKLAAAKKSKARSCRRWQRIGMKGRQKSDQPSRCNHHSNDKNMNYEVDQIARYYKNEGNVNIEQTFNEFKREQNSDPQSGILSREAALMSSVDSNNPDQRSLLSSSIPDATMHRDVVSVATKAEASSMYRGYKFSFDLGSHKKQAVFPAKKTNKLPRAQDAAVNSCSQMLEKFDQQIQGALNNM